MFKIGKTENRLVILVITLLLISLIGFLDYITGSELSFSLFYLIPISLLALYKRSTVVMVISSSVIAALLWFIAEYNSRDYSNIFLLIWNAVVPLLIFMIIGLLILYLKEHHKKLNGLNANLNLLIEEKNKFIGTAAHDLRNPMSGIYAFSELLLEHDMDKDKAEILKVLQIIKTLSSKTLIMLGNLLDISKIESGKVELKLKNQDYILFVKQQIYINEILAGNKNITIKLDTQFDSLPADIDEHYLGEVIDNLLSNAIKYSGSGSEIQVKISMPDTKHILTEVIDKGKGIPEGEQQKLFQYFQTTSTRPTAGEESTGLGLAIARKIVNLHKGEIGMKGNVSEGSNFYFILPLNNE